MAILLLLILCVLVWIAVVFSSRITEVRSAEQKMIEAARKAERARLDAVNAEFKGSMELQKQQQEFDARRAEDADDE